MAARVAIFAALMVTVCNLPLTGFAEQKNSILRDERAKIRQFLEEALAADERQDYVTFYTYLSTRFKAELREKDGVEDATQSWTFIAGTGDSNNSSERRRSRLSSSAPCQNPLLLQYWLWLCPKC